MSSLNPTLPAEATVRSAVAPVHAEPRASSTQVTQYLAGRTVVVVERRDDWRHVRGADGYEGWMHRGYLAAAAPDAVRHDLLERISLGCVVLDGVTDTARSLPLGALLLPDAVIVAGEAVTESERVRSFPLSAGAIVQSTQLFEGTSYQWGGVTPWGADCSGFVQSIFALHGVALPRDAWMQVETGSPAADDIMDASAADLLFFSEREDRRITHVAIALGGARIAHLAIGRGGYAVEDLRLDDDPYVAGLRSRFTRARRIMQGSRVS
jgi:gamma-D-glutamyl-L-lysine dipeptidyl-peptidase